MAKQPQQAEQTEDEIDADLDVGFASEGAPPAKKGSEVATDIKTGAAAAEVKTPPVAAAPVKIDPPDPDKEVVQLTRGDLQRLLAATDRSLKLEGRMQSVFGSVGNLQQAMKEIKTNRQTGKVVLSDADFAEMSKEFPELADYTRKGLQTVFDKIHERQEAGSTQEIKKDQGEGGKKPGEETVDAEKVDRQRRIARELEILDDSHPTWKSDTGIGQDGKVDYNHPYRAWMAKQPADYQQRLNNSDNAIVIGRSIDKYNEETRKAAEAAVAAAAIAAQQKPGKNGDTRRDRLKEAVQPKGDGGAGPSSKTEDDEFNDGFKTG